MPIIEDDDDGMDDLAGRTADEVDEELSDLEAALLRESAGMLQQLKVILSDPESFAKLVEAVDQASRQNENVAAFGRRLRSAGERVVTVAKAVAKLV